MLIAAAAVATGLVCASPAMATITEIGPTGDAAPGTPACPDDCIAVTRTTGYQLSTATAKDVMVIPKSGRIVAWTISLGNPSTKPTKDPDTGKKGKSQVQFFNDNYGGDASAGIAILTTGTKRRARTIALSPIIKLTQYFGKTVQFALEQSIAVKKGDLVALNVPTSAPGAGRRPARYVRVARQPHGELLGSVGQPAADVADARPADAVQLRLQDGAPDLHGDADLDAVGGPRAARAS